ncbi:MAG: hypothetical protein ACJ748_17465 [Flavisolibacter sp.]|jgi:hypothetical protein
MDKELDTPHVHLELKEGILIGTYKKGLKINLQIAKEIVDARIKFTGNKLMPALIYNQGVISMDKSAREFFSSDEGVSGLKAAAIILDSPFASFLGNFFVFVNKTKMPVRIFSNTPSALKWLKKFAS